MQITVDLFVVVTPLMIEKIGMPLCNITVGFSGDGSTTSTEGRGKCGFDWQ